MKASNWKDLKVSSQTSIRSGDGIDSLSDASFAVGPNHHWYNLAPYFGRILLVFMGILVVLVTVLRQEAN